MHELKCPLKAVSQAKWICVGEDNFKAEESKPASAAASTAEAEVSIYAFFSLQLPILLPLLLHNMFSFLQHWWASWELQLAMGIFKAFTEAALVSAIS